MKESQIADEEFGGTGNDHEVCGACRGEAAHDYKVMTDEELAGCLKRDRDEEAFNELVDRYADGILRLALRITLNKGDAEDVLQDAFLAIEKPDTFREDAKFSTWFYRIALNLCFTRLRAEKKHKRNVSLDEFPPYREYGALEGGQGGLWGARPDDAVSTREGLRIIEEAMSELPAGYRAVFQLRDVEGLTNNEVANILQLSLPNVKSRVHRARLFLRERLSGYFCEAHG